MDPTEARLMFHMAEQNRTTVPDGYLDTQEVRDMFGDFDRNGQYPGAVCRNRYYLKLQRDCR
jgi:hypothetical protein